MSCGTSKTIAIPNKKESSLCINHEEVHCSILKDYGDGRVDLGIVFPYCLAGATSGISELINSLLYCSVFSFIENYVVYDFDIEKKIELFKGPRIGVLGIRQWTNTFQTPLVGVILKPRTKIDLHHQSDIIEDLCNTGLINYIIDDELVVSPACCPYEEKIDIYYDLISGIEQKIGNRLLYWINATA